MTVGTTADVTAAAPPAVEGAAAPLAVEGAAAPPRVNGELVFTEPWESRAFGMAVSLSEQGAFAWATFQAALVARIAAWEATHPDGIGYRYYLHWLDALQDVLGGDGTATAAEVEARAGALATRPAGHDHDGHDHDGHDHGHPGPGS